VDWADKRTGPRTSRRPIVGARRMSLLQSRLQPARPAPPRFPRNCFSRRRQADLRAFPRSSTKYAQYSIGSRQQRKRFGMGAERSPRPGARQGPGPRSPLAVIPFEYGAPVPGRQFFPRLSVCRAVARRVGRRPGNRSQSGWAALGRKEWSRDGARHLRNVPTAGIDVASLDREPGSLAGVCA
jgi:hypothetical protein